MPRTPHPPFRGSAGLAAKAVLVTLLLTVAAGVSYLAASGSSAASNAKPALAVQVAPASQTVTRGQSAQYAVSVTGVNGFTGQLALSTSRLPSGLSAQFAPATATISTNAAVTSTLTVGTGSAAAPGNTTFTITATGDKVSGSVTAGLSVSAELSGSLSISASPASVTMAPGSTAVYSLQLASSNLAGAVSLAIYGSLPSGATAGFSPNPVSGSSSTLQVSSADTIADGSYPLTVVASGQDAGGRAYYAYATVQLVIQTSGKAFEITGNLTGQLSPGAAIPLDLLLTNPNKKQLAITNLTVTVQGVTRTAAAAAANQPCGIADYAVVQYSGGYPLTVAGSSSLRLSQLNVASTARPQILMRDTNTDQDGCKGATVTLGYAGSGQGS